MVRSPIAFERLGAILGPLSASHPGGSRSRLLARPS